MTEQSCCDGCGKPPYVQADGSGWVSLKRCTRCHQACYHNAECQRLHYQKHKIECRRSLSNNDCAAAIESDSGQVVARYVNNFQVEKRMDRGNCLVALRNVRPGQAIMAADQKSYFKPIAPPVLFQACRRSRCAVCFGAVATSNNSAMRLCDNPNYMVTICSEVCREKSRQWLPQEIRVVSSILESYHSNNNSSCHPQILPTAILVYRLFNVAVWKEVMEMQTHDLAFGGDEDDSAQAHQLAVVMLVLQMIAKTDGLAQRTVMRSDDSSSVISLAHRIAQVLNRIKYNAFTVTTNDDAIGFAVYGSPSFRINHSCQPNAVQRFIFATGEPPRLRIDICQSIEPGQEVCLTYIENLEAPAQDRREILVHDYKFFCRCPRCEHEERKSPKDSVING